MFKGTRPKDFGRRWSRLQKKIPTIVGVTATNFFKERFSEKSWKDEAVTKWPARSASARRNKGRALLVDTGRLRRSIRVIKKTSNQVVVGSNVPYAKAHNYGAHIRGRFRVRKHKRGKSTVKAHSRNVNYRLPQRQFIGRSRVLNKKIGKEVEEILREI